MSRFSRYLIEISLAAHTKLLRDRERAANAGCLTAYDAKSDLTSWLVAGEVVGVSEGPLGTNTRYWATAALTPSQHSLVTDQLSNNEVSSDEEMIELFIREGAVTRSNALALMYERERCLARAMYEPLSEGVL
jgi:hypothetical protein